EFLKMNEKNEERVILHEIPPRSIPLESIDQEFSQSLRRKKKGIFIMKFSKKRLSRAFFHLFTCCIAPSEQLIEAKKGYKDHGKKNVENSQLFMEQEYESLTRKNTLKNMLMKTLKNTYNDEEPFEMKESINENSELDTFPQINRDLISKNDKKIDLSILFSRESETENAEIVQHSLSPDISIEIDESPTMNSLTSTVHSEYRKWLLSPILEADRGKKCLVLDLDETLVHSSFKIIHQADFIIPIKIDSIYHNVYVIKRPGVDSFMKRMGELFEIVIFTASLAKYADPVLDMLDIHHVIKHRLFRESCFNHQGNYVKNLSQLGRELKNVLIIDNSPASYIFHPTHAVPISSWFNDVHDTELLDLIPFLEDLTTVPDVTAVLDLGLA
ncbi:hypothetical protein PCK1_001899, partial [Pneumocystis canis]